MSSRQAELEVLKQRIVELEAKNAELEAEKAELLKRIMEENTRRDVRVEEQWKSSRIMIILLTIVHLTANSAKRLNGKPLEEKDMDSFLLEAHKKIVSSEIKQRNKEKKLSKAEQASLNQDRESDTRCSTSEKIPEVTNPVTKISAGAPGQNSHRKKGAENIVQLIADGIMEDAQSSDKAILCDMISIESLNPSTDPLLSLAQLFDKADDAEYGAIRANQEEILRNMVRISAGGPGQNSSDDSKEIIPSNSLEDVDDYYKTILEECAKDCEYFDKEVDSTSQPVKETNEEVAWEESNEIKSDNDSDSDDSEEEMPDDSDDDGYNGYGGYGEYNEYGERDRGYYRID